MASLPFKKVGAECERRGICPSAQARQGYPYVSGMQVPPNVARSAARAFAPTHTRQLSVGQSAQARHFSVVQGCLLAGILLSSPSTGWAEEDPRVRRVGDWEILCDESMSPQGGLSGAPLKTASRCKAVQRLTVEETDETVFVITVLPGEKAEPVAIVSVPLGGYLVPGVEFTVDGRKPYKLLIETCTAAGCHAGFPLSGRVDKDMRAGKVASFRIWSAKSKSADVHVSLNGFADAMAQLERRP